VLADDALIAQLEVEKRYADGPARAEFLIEALQ
jgi:hypothetical protein